MKKEVSLLLVEDHIGYRETIQQALNSDSHIKEIICYSTAEIALRNLQKQKYAAPDIIILDLNLPGISGIEAIDWFKQYSPNSKILILTQSDKQADILAAISKGAVGYLLKSSTVTLIKSAIKTVLEGGASLDPKMAQYLLNTIRDSPHTPINENILSERELEILNYISDGLGKKEISDKLKISVNTISTYTRRIYEKLEVTNAPAAVRKAYRSGIFPLKNKK